MRYGNRGSRGPAQFPLDRCDHPRVGRLDLRGKAPRDVAIAPDQIFVEIPARSFEWTLRSSPLVERVRVLAFDRYLLGYRKRDVILALWISLTLPGS